MRIRALFAQVTPLCTVSVVIQPHETIATLFEIFRKVLQSYRKHREFTGAYSIVHTQKSGIQEEDDEVYAIVDGEPDVIAKYLIPASRMNPSKTVAHYFGNGVPPGAATVVLTLPDESLALEKQLESMVIVECLPERRDGMNPPPTPSTVSALPNETTTTGRATTVSSSCLSWVARCCPNVVGRDDAQTNE